MAHNLTNEKFADMHMVYGAAHGNAREVVGKILPTEVLESIFAQSLQRCQLCIEV